MNQTTSVYDLPRQELIDLFAGRGFSAYHAEQLWASLYRTPTTEDTAADRLRPELGSWLTSEMALQRPAIAAEVESSDGLTRKYLLRLADGQMIETVLMHYEGRATACLSTQAGCAMGCVFCATGQMGFVRNLSSGEIVVQALQAADDLARQGSELRNIVFMGMGEPLHNYEATMTAVDILTDHKGLAIGPRYITLSTVGLPPAIRRLARDERPINLAVSLHAATDPERSALVPINERWSLSELMDACREYVQIRGRRIFFEWALIAGQNDSSRQARQLGRLLEGLQAHVNLIPLNPTAGYGGGPSDNDAARRFQAILADYGLPSTVRQRRGIDVNAGCGQLRARAIRTRTGSPDGP